MKELINVVIAYGGEYEDAWESNRVVSFDLDKINTYITNQLTTQSQRNHDVKKYWEAYGEFNEGVPSADYIPSEKYPKWGGGIKQSDITVEMREERNAIIASNKEKDEINSAASKVRSDIIEAWSVKFFKELGYAEDDEFLSKVRWSSREIDETKFRIETIEFMRENHEI